MGCKVTELEIPGVQILEPDYFEDFRGYYSETYSSRTLRERGINLVFVQDNHFLSLKAGTIRGVHFQNAPAVQTKLVRCTRGALRVFAVDLRLDSPTFTKWVQVELSEENRRQILIPKGFGHGCVSLVDNTEGQYKVDAFYEPSLDRAISWKDSEIALPWGFNNPVVSPKDASAPMLAESDCNFTMENCRG